MVDGAELETIRRRSDEPTLGIGESVVLKDGRHGVVLARYIPSAHRTEVRYIVQVEQEKHGKRKPSA